MTVPLETFALFAKVPVTEPFIAACHDRGHDPLSLFVRQFRRALN